MIEFKDDTHKPMNDSRKTIQYMKEKFDKEGG
jgi:hypothetical protein